MSSRGYKRYALVVLAAVYMLNQVDRGLMVLLLQPIKQDLGLSDTQLGFVTGIAFGLFYATLGLPIARWADRGDRVTITSLAIGLWGLTVMACVIVGNYAQLVFARIAAAVGESGCKPPTYSLIGDYFPEAGERIRAMAVYMLASPVAILLSLALGGWLNEMYGWRLTFFFMGIPGLLLAILVKLTVIEPRMQPGRVTDQAASLPPMRAVLAVLWRQRSCRHLAFALVLLFTMGSGLGPWYAAFMIRSHGMTTSELGIWLGMIFGVCGTAGVLLGGTVLSRWFANNERAQLRLSALTMASVVPCFVAFLTLPHRYQALLALMPLMIVFSFFQGPTYAVMQRLVADEMRATMLALVMLLANLIGMGVGPQIVGLLSDMVAPVAGRDSLRYAMLTMSFVAFWSAYHFWQAGETVQEDLLSAHRHDLEAEDLRVAFPAQSARLNCRK